MDSDIIFCIFNFLDSKDIINCSEVNRQFNKIATNELLWKELYVKKFDIPCTNYKKQYITNDFMTKLNYDPAMDTNDITVLYSRSNLNKLPDEIKLLTNLETIDISHDLCQISPEIGQLKKLSSISFAYTNINCLPP